MYKIFYLEVYLKHMTSSDQFKDNITVELLYVKEQIVHMHFLL